MQHRFVLTILTHRFLVKVATTKKSKAKKHGNTEIVFSCTACTEQIVVEKCNHKLLVNFTIIYKGMASNTELNMTFWIRQTKFLFSC